MVVISISIISKDEYQELLSDEPFTGILLAENDEKVYILYTPLDLAIMDSRKQEEYKILHLSHDEIKERFKILN